MVVSFALGVPYWMDYRRLVTEFLLCIYSPSLRRIDGRRAIIFLQSSEDVINLESGCTEGLRRLGWSF